MDIVNLVPIKLVVCIKIVTTVLWFQSHAADSLASCPAGKFDRSPGLRVEALVSGDGHTCSLRNDRSVACWGANAAGGLGIGSSADLGNVPGQMESLLKAANLGTGLGATAISAAGFHTCVLRNDSRVVCFGANSYGQLGIGSATNVGTSAAQMGNNLKAVDVGTGFTVLAISSGYNHNCAVRNDRSVVCWGRNSNGQLGIGSTTTIGISAGQMGDSLIAADVGTGLSVVALASGSYHNCALRNDKTLVCWGLNSDGQLGIGNTNDVGTAAGQMGNSLQAVNLGTNFTIAAISAGNIHSCALRSTGSVVCWGGNDAGQLGIGSTSGVGSSASQMGNNLQAVKLGTDFTIIGIAAAYRQTYALSSNGSVFGWGANSMGELGLGNTNNVGTSTGPILATDLGTGFTAIGIAGGGLWHHQCAIRNDGSVACWGWNNYGQLGIGSSTNIGTTSGQMGNNLQAAHLGSVTINCSVCPSGTSSQAGATICTSCAPGWYSNATGATVCMACAPGWYSNAAGSVNCSVCPNGTTSPSAGSISCASCSQFTCPTQSGSCDPVIMTLNISSKTDADGNLAYFCSYQDGGIIQAFRCTIPANFAAGRSLACKMDDSSQTIVCV